VSRYLTIAAGAAQQCGDQELLAITMAARASHSACSGDPADGLAFAREADLRHTELVTLPACEPALGRFDLPDNLRGLPAAFLEAGATAVIGALWPVGAAPATTFFTALYTRLAAGDAKLTAYRAAQATTREKHLSQRPCTGAGRWSRQAPWPPGQVADEVGDRASPRSCKRKCGAPVTRADIY
jgi:CHAT domain-containing protein